MNSNNEHALPSFATLPHAYCEGLPYGFANADGSLRAGCNVFVPESSQTFALIFTRDRWGEFVSQIEDAFSGLQQYERPCRQLNSKTDRRRTVSKKCDATWTAYKDWRLIEETKDCRAYAFGGMWVHPCGNSFQEGGRDGFVKDEGDEFCDCALCSEFRQEFCS
jgi:hypothetical protein